MILIGRGLNHEAGVSGGEGSTPSRKDPLERKERRSVQVNSNCAVVKVRIKSVGQKGEPEGNLSRSGTIKENTISGGNGGRVPPVPIPNTEVKPLSADGTWLETARESRSPPDSILKSCCMTALLFLLTGKVLA